MINRLTALSPGIFLFFRQIFFGNIAITSSGNSIPSQLNNLRVIGGDLWIRGTSVYSLSGTFTNLVSVGGSLIISGNLQLYTLGNGFNQLRKVYGQLTIGYCSTGFTSLYGTFPQLVNVTGGVTIDSLQYLTDVRTSFQRLRWVNGLISLYVFALNDT